MDRGRLSIHASSLGSLDQQVSGAGPSRSVAGLQREEALSRVGDDLDLLKEIAQLFLDDCGNMMDAVEQAVSTADPQALERSAHALKGCVSNFGADDAYKAAFDLEQLGRALDLAPVAPAYVRLQSAIQALCPELRALIAE